VQRFTASQQRPLNALQVRTLAGARTATETSQQRPLNALQVQTDTRITNNGH